eukprot:746855-Hanusia_phi.AAC.6
MTVEISTLRYFLSRSSSFSRSLPTQGCWLAAGATGRGISRPRLPGITTSFRAEEGEEGESMEGKDSWMLIQSYERTWIARER